MCLEKGFLSNDPEQWIGDASYEDFRTVVSALCVTNDVAEHAVGLMKDFNKSLAQSEEQKPHTLQVVEQNRQRNPNL